MYTATAFSGYRDVEFSVCAFDTVGQQCQVAFKGYQATTISSLDSTSPDFGWRKLCFSLDWKPDLGLLTAEQLSSYCSENVKGTDPYSAEFSDSAELVCLFCLHAAYEELSAEAFTSPERTIMKYMEWMKMQIDKYEAAHPISKPDERNPSLKDHAYFRSLLTQIESSREKNVIVEAGKNLAKILRGEMNALAVLFDDGGVQELYSGATFGLSYQKAAIYIDLLAHKNPSLKILKVGAGTGGMTGPILDQLSKPGSDEGDQPNFSQYSFTDISAGFFQAAFEKFSEYAERMTFQVFDVEMDPSTQGYEVGTYDVVIVSSVRGTAQELSVCKIAQLTELRSFTLHLTWRMPLAMHANY